MKKYILAGVVVLLFVLYAIRGQFKSKTDTTVATNDTTQDTNSASHETTNPNAGGSPTPTPTPVATGTYKDGSYTGKVTDAFYGPFQVKALISGGKLTDVVFVQYPNDRPESIQINNVSNKELKAEAIKAQSANVDIVSGATQSSEAFQKSLADALSQAK